MVERNSPKEQNLEMTEIERMLVVGSQKLEGTGLEVWVGKPRDEVCGWAPCGHICGPCEGQLQQRRLSVK